MTTTPDPATIPARVIGPSGQTLAHLSLPLESVLAVTGANDAPAPPGSWPVTRARLESALTRSMTAHGLDPDRSERAVRSALDAYERWNDRAPGGRTR